jgi:transcriptional pleiotropic regulator of transition state genes
MEIYVDGQTIVLKKYQPACVFCGDAEGAVHFKEKLVCSSCRAELVRK